MNLLLFERSELDDDGRLPVVGRRLQHLRHVHGKVAGDSVRVGEINGQVGVAEIITIGAKQALLRPDLGMPPPPKLPLVLVLALPRPKMLRRILRTAAELGVPELHLLHSYRVEKSYWQTPALQPETVNDYLLQGLEQARDTVLPKVHLQRRFKPFVEDQLPGLVQGRRALLAHPGDYPACPRGLAGPALAVIGPEGGFIPYEVEKLSAAGCETVALGPRILRVENAVTSLLARLY